MSLPIRPSGLSRISDYSSGAKSSSALALSTTLRKAVFLSKDNPELRDRLTSGSRVESRAEGQVKKGGRGPPCRDRPNITWKICFLIHFYYMLYTCSLLCDFHVSKVRVGVFTTAISRFVHGLFIFGTSGGRCPEAEEFLSLMHRWAAFGGIRIRKYVLMANHFHLLCEVPEPRSLTQKELLKRIEIGYGCERVQTLREQLAHFAQQPEGLEPSKHLLDSYCQQMNDLSFFMKQLKGCFAQQDNRRHQRYGTVWSERFKSVLLEGGQAVAAIAAYIDLNPVRAGLCEDPKDYRYCDYAEAIAKDCATALEGMRSILNLPPEANPDAERLRVGVPEVERGLVDLRRRSCAWWCSIAWSTIQRTTPPTKIASVVAIDRYAPTANVSDRTPSSSTTITSATPSSTSAHGSLRDRIPLITVAISRPCGAAAFSLPMPWIHCTSISPVAGL